MKREEIEHLLVEYVNGEISIADRQRLEELFKKDLDLKQEAEEMAKTWNSLHKMEENIETSHRMDTQFYDMLDASKNSRKSNNNMFEIKTKWLKPLIAAAACIAMFIIGRITVPPEQVTSYKTVYIKAPVTTEKPNTDLVEIQSVNSPKSIKSSEDITNTVLAQKLRSVYASERIAAITELSKYKNLAPEVLKILGLALKEDPNPNVRLMIINVLQPLSDQQNVQNILITSLNQQEDQLIQTSIIDLLVDAKSKQAIPQMITLLENKNTDMIVQEKIKDGIEKFLY